MLANLRHTDATALGAQIIANAARIFRLPPDKL